MREASELRDVGHHTLFTKGSHERLPVKDFHVAARAAPVRLVRSDDSARGFLYRCDRSSGSAPAAPSPVIQEDDPPAVVKDSLGADTDKPRASRSSMSTNVSSRVTSAIRLSIPHAGVIRRLGSARALTDLDQGGSDVTDRGSATRASRARGAVCRTRCRGCGRGRRATRPGVARSGCGR